MNVAREINDHPHAMITIEPMTPNLGAYVSGVDLRQELDAEAIASLRDAWLTHHVLFFRDQELTLDQHRRFAQAFGPLYQHPMFRGPDSHPEALVIRAGPKTTKPAGEGWHTDVSSSPTPPSASILRLEVVPEVGGDTMFCNMVAAYEALSDHWKRFVEPLDAHHSSAQRHGRQFGIAADEYPEATHPVVRTHPETDQKALYVNQGFTTSIDGMTAAESRATLEFLFRHCENPAFHARFQWQPNSMAMWDNRAVMHHAIFDYHPAVRRGYRFTVTGDAPRR